MTWEEKEMSEGRASTLRTGKATLTLGDLEELEGQRESILSGAKGRKRNSEKPSTNTLGKSKNFALIIQ